MFFSVMFHLKMKLSQIVFGRGENMSIIFVWWGKLFSVLLKRERRWQKKQSKRKLFCCYLEFLSKMQKYTLVFEKMKIMNCSYLYHSYSFCSWTTVSVSECQSVSTALLQGILGHRPRMSFILHLSAFKSTSYMLLCPKSDPIMTGLVCISQKTLFLEFWCSTGSQYIDFLQSRELILQETRR